MVHKRLRQTEGRIFPRTVSNIHLPACIDEASQHNLKLCILKKMKRGLRSKLEAAKMETRNLNAELNSRYAADKEALQRCRTLSFNTAFRHESARLHDKLQRLGERGWPLRGATTIAGPTPAATAITDKTNELSAGEKKVLSRGPKFALAAEINERTEEACQTAFARFAYQYLWSIARDHHSEAASRSEVADLPTFPRSSEINVPPTADPNTESTLRRISSALTTIVRSLPKRRKWSNLPQDEAAELEALRSKPVALMPSDKGGEFCAVDQEVYRDLGRSHLSDTATYRPIPRMTAKTVEGKINNTWRTICRERGVSTRCLRSYISSNTRLATFHHVIKTHKPGPQLKIRPIIASRDSPTERIAWLLCSILSPLLKDVPTHLADSTALMTTVAGTSPQTLSRYHHQCSLDVQALYTSVPVDEALLAMRDKLQQHGGAVPNPLRVEDVILLLKAVFNLAYFHYDGKIYRQASGLPMGCAVSGIVAILFLERIEARALDQFARCPLFRRYVDDCYALVENEEEARELQEVFNRQHPAIKYELEDCTRNQDTTSLSLLDLTINVNQNGEASFDFYTKPARSSIFVHKDAALPWRQKAAAIRNERQRIEARCNRSSRETNKTAFEEKLRANGYTANDLGRTNPTGRRRRRRPDTTRGGVHYIDLPFLGEAAEHRIRRAFQREGVNIRIFRRSTSILDIVRPRQPEIRRCIWDTCPTQSTSQCFVKNCVYQVTCTPCGQRYIGSTTRPLHERIREHTTQGRGSTIHGHLTDCGGGTAQVEVRILAREKDAVNTRLREALLIKKLRPQLNTREECDLIDLVS